MPQKNLILNSLRQSFSLIWSNKSLFFLIFVLQIIFFIILSSINYAYGTRMIEKEKAIEDYINQLKLDEASVTSNILQQKSILGDDPLSISRNFNEILRNFKLYLVYTFLLLIFFVSLNWAITNKLLYKTNSKHLIKNFIKNLVISSFYIGLIFAFFFSLFNVSLSGLTVETTKLFANYLPFLLFSIVLVYFMYVSLSLSHGFELKNIVQKTLTLGIKKAHYIFAVYSINLLLFCISAVLFYYFIEGNLLVLVLAVLLLIFSFGFGRIFMVKVVDKLEKN